MLCLTCNIIANVNFWITVNKHNIIPDILIVNQDSCV